MRCCLWHSLCMLSKAHVLFSRRGCEKDTLAALQAYTRMSGLECCCFLQGCQGFCHHASQCERTQHAIVCSVDWVERFSNLMGVKCSTKAAYDSSCYDCAPFGQRAAYVAVSPAVRVQVKWLLS
ncbi:hypothetical protein COO60DRAFT_1233812 [Scenedesmus sp. NREL 46B-D3]|nr:hypothetical protein COO60DRAFT_1233812 [Scenedesmus sp. NREL 46B-D3]